jgi:hypothetical protein
MDKRKDFNKASEYIQRAARLVAHRDCDGCGGTGEGATCDVAGICMRCIRLWKAEATS